MFWVDYREPLKSGNLTKYRIRRDKMIHQLLIPQFQRHRELKSVQGTQTRDERVTFHQQFGPSKFRLPDRENFQFPGGDVSSKLAQKYVCIVAVNGLRSTLIANADVSSAMVRRATRITSSAVLTI
jgi:hypothetical protein